MPCDETKEHDIRSIARDSVAWVMEYHSRHNAHMLSAEEIGDVLRDLGANNR